MRSKQTGMVAYISLVHGLIHTVEFSYAALLSRIDTEFGAGLFVLGIIANGFAFMFGFSALPSGVLVDRIGTQRVLTIAFALAAIAALLVATSPNTVMLGLFLGLLGLSIGLYHPAGISFIAQATSRRGLALGWHGLAGNVGIAHGHHGIQLKVASLSGQGHGGIVAHDLHRHLNHGLGDDRIDLAGHYRAAGLNLG